MRTHALPTLTLTLLTLTTACRSADSYDLETEYRTTSICTSGCGNTTSNSPEFNEYEINTLGLLGQPNDDGLVLVGIRSPKGNLRGFTAEDDELIALNDAHQIVAKGVALVDWTLILSAGNEVLEVQILDYTNALPSWAVGGSPISAYALAYERAGELVSVCPNADPSETVVTILQNVVYDPEAHEVVDENGWLTLACADNAAFKMKLMGYSRYEKDRYPQPTEAERQATIRMITADYCGDGTSFTVQGMPLDWQNSIGTVLPQHDPEPKWENVEAIWDVNGAICLSTPRLAMLAEVEASCPLPPPCDPMMLESAHEWVTWVVPEVPLVPVVL